MKGDFARDTFDPGLNYSRVFQQQGRVLLEADWNEASAIQLHLLRTLVCDLIGRCWAVGDGFAIVAGATNADGTTTPSSPVAWQLRAGHFYADGILCVNATDCMLAQQPHAPTPDDAAPGAGSAFDQPPASFALWLDVWERHVCAVEAPRIADVALEGIETASRAQVLWQARPLDLTHLPALVADLQAALQARPPDALVQQRLATLASLAKGVAEPDNSPCALARTLLDARATFAVPALAAQLASAPTASDPCAIAPDARYRGCENQLYRVEIHQGGIAGTATFKWSRENGSVVFALDTCGPATTQADGTLEVAVTLASLGRDARLGLAVNDWVELVDDPYTLAQRTYALWQVGAIDAANRAVTLTAPGGTSLWPLGGAAQHPLLRRWDQHAGVNPQGVVAVSEGAANAVTLEDGIQITFAPGGLYATGDHWLIPARVANGGQLDWPLAADGTALALPPRGRHHHAVLGTANSDGYTPCACRFGTLCTLIHAAQNQESGVAAPHLNLAAAPPSVPPVTPSPATAPAPAVRKVIAKTARVRKPT